MRPKHSGVVAHSRFPQISVGKTKVLLKMRLAQSAPRLQNTQQLLPPLLPLGAAPGFFFKLFLSYGIRFGWNAPHFSGVHSKLM